MTQSLGQEWKVLKIYIFLQPFTKSYTHLIPHIKSPSACNSYSGLFSYDILIDIPDEMETYNRN